MTMGSNDRVVVNSLYYVFLTYSRLVVGEMGNSAKLTGTDKKQT